jgi:hypothetical protein
MKRSSLLFIAALGLGWICPIQAEDQPAADKPAGKPAGIVVIDLNKLPPDVAKRLLDELAKLQGPADKGMVKDGEARNDKGKPNKGKAGEKPSKGKARQPEKGQPQGRQPNKREGDK